MNCFTDDLNAAARMKHALNFSAALASFTHPHAAYMFVHVSCVHMSAVSHGVAVPTGALLWWSACGVVAVVQVASQVVAVPETAQQRDNSGLHNEGGSKGIFCLLYLLCMLPFPNTATC
jgi:hypothetical protein